jgi:hypothetical protein
VYTIVANLMLYRLAWALNIHLWCEYRVNYMSIFRFEEDVKPNLLQVLNHSCTVVVLFFINLTLFFQFNFHPMSAGAYGGENMVNFLNNGLPVLLAATVILYEVYNYYSYTSRGINAARGLFSLPVLYGCITTLCKESGVSFRESYVTNLLTTFTKIYADLMHALCWILSGAFLLPGQTIDNYGSDYMSCRDTSWDLVIVVLQVLPQLVRIAQQYRSYRDTGMRTYLINVSKYILTTVVIVYGFFQNSYSGVYLALVIILATFKWFWDVYMNWGLFENGSFHCHQNAHQGFFLLRKQRMFPSPMLYYVSIVVNLALRFAWVMSLLSSSGPAAQRQWGVFAGTKLSIFLGSLEIVRRSLWGLLRTEYEHIKFVNKKTPGMY